MARVHKAELLDVLIAVTEKVNSLLTIPLPASARARVSTTSRDKIEGLLSAVRK